MATTRFPTRYPGVYFRLAKRIGKSGEEKVFYVTYKKDGKTIEEKVGRQYADDMIAAKASAYRSSVVEGRIASRQERRKVEQKQAEMVQTIGELWDAYAEYLQDKASFRTDKSNFKNYLAFFSKLKIAELTTIHVEGLRRKMEKVGKKPQTVKHALMLLKRMLSYGEKKGLCVKPAPTQLRIELPSVDNRKTEIMTEAQQAAFLEALKDEEPLAAAFLHIAFLTGVRRNALLALRWEDLNFQENFIVLRGENAKSGKTQIIPMSHKVRDILLSLDKVSEYVFPGRYGGHREDFVLAKKRVRDKAGLPKDFRPLHGLRHNFASQLASSGKVDMYTLQKLLTHESPEMTQRYAALADKALRRAADIADELLSQSDKDIKEPHK